MMIEIHFHAEYTCYERLHPKRLTSYPMRCKKSSALITASNPLNPGTKTEKKTLKKKKNAIFWLGAVQILRNTRGGGGGLGLAVKKKKLCDKKAFFLNTSLRINLEQLIDCLF